LSTTYSKQTRTAQIGHARHRRAAGPSFSSGCRSRPARSSTRSSACSSSSSWKIGHEGAETRPQAAESTRKGSRSPRETFVFGFQTLPFCSRQSVREFRSARAREFATHILQFPRPADSLPASLVHFFTHSRFRSLFRTVAPSWLAPSPFCGWSSSDPKRGMFWNLPAQNAAHSRIIDGVNDRL
jgi:hypothetical protein